jgi:hypothetical protein
VAVAETPSGAVRFVEVADGHFVQEMDEAQGHHNGKVRIIDLTSQKTNKFTP